MGDVRGRSASHSEIQQGSYRNEPISILDLNLGQKIAIGCGHMVNDITAAIWFSYYLMYSQEVVGFSGNAAAALMLLGQLVDGIATPLVGYEADLGWGDENYWMCRSGFGRYKSWHLIGVVLACGSFPFIFSPPVGYSGSSEIAKVIYYIPFIVIYEVSWAAVQISHLALIPKMNPDILTRTEILSIRYVLMVVSAMVVFVITWTSVGTGSNCVIDKRDVPTFQHLGFITMGLGLLTSIIFYVCTKEHHDDKVKEAVAIWEAEEEEARYRRENGLCGGQRSGPRLSLTWDGQRDEDLGIVNENKNTSLRVSLLRRKRRSLSTKYLNPERERMTAKDWISLPQFYMVGAVYITGRLVINVPQAFLPLYLQETLHLPCRSIATIPMTYFSSGLVVSLLMKTMNKHFGRQLTFAFAIILNLTGASIILWADWTPGTFLPQTGIYGVFALLGGGASAGMVTGLSITADMIGNNVESGAFVYGFMSFCDKFSCGITIMVINLFCPKILPGESSKRLEEFYKSVIGGSCIACSCLALLGLSTLTLLIYKENKRKERLETQRRPQSSVNQGHYPGTVYQAI